MGTYRNLDQASPKGGTYRRLDLASAKPAAKPQGGAVGDVAQSYASGAMDSMQGLAAAALRSLSPVDVLGLVKMGLQHAPDNAVTHAARFALGVNSALANHQPQTTAGRYARVAGEMTPNALAGPAGAVRGGAANALGRFASVAAPAVTSEGARQLAQAMNGGKRAQAVASTAGAIVGGVASGGRIVPRGVAGPENALNLFAKKAAPDVGQMIAKRDEFRSVGIKPTLTDVTDETGRGAIRAAASRMSAGRQVAQTFADKRALDLPDRIGKQARRVMSSDPRTPQAIAEDLAKQRKDIADQQYGLVRDQQFEPTHEATLALRTDHGRAAIKLAAAGERNPDARAALNRLSDDAMDAPRTKITVGMADGIARALKGRAEAHARSGDNNLASIYNMLADDVRGAATAAVPDYGKAVKNYAESSRLIDAAGKGEDLLKKNTDEFVADAKRMSPAARTIARATGRRAIERAAGENVGSAPGVARRIADAPEQQARNAALLGADAPKLEKGMRLEERAVQNAREIAPKTGSQTELRASDKADMAVGAAHVAAHVVAQNHIGAGAAGVKLWLKSRGMTDAQAHEMVKLATDPSKTDDAIAALHALYGPKQARTIINRLSGPRGRTAITSAALASGAVAAQPQQ